MESKWFHHISSTEYTLPCLSEMIALHQTVANCQNTLTVLTLRWRVFLWYVWMDQTYVTDVGTTQDNFIPDLVMPHVTSWYLTLRHFREVYFIVVCVVTKDKAQIMSGFERLLSTTLVYWRYRLEEYKVNFLMK